MLIHLNYLQFNHFHIQLNYLQSSHEILRFVDEYLFNLSRIATIAIIYVSSIHHVQQIFPISPLSPFHIFRTFASNQSARFDSKRSSNRFRQAERVTKVHSARRNSNGLRLDRVFIRMKRTLKTHFDVAQNRYSPRLYAGWMPN